MGDSALRAGLLAGLRGSGAQLHITLEGQSEDYLAGISIREDDIYYRSRSAWIDVCARVSRPVYVVNAGEINPAKGGRFPHRDRIAEMRSVLKRRGIVIAAGVGLKDPSVASSVSFGRAFREAAVMTWRDRDSRAEAGFGGVAPDWAFALGSASPAWSGYAERRLLALTLRFDRELPSPAWFDRVRSFAAASRLQIVTVAQVARDAPRAVALAERLDGEYLVAPSTRHDEVDQHVRSVYASSVAVVSDRAHALIMAATEGAYPVGSAVDPQKIDRLLRAVGLEQLTGTHDGIENRLERLPSVHSTLALPVSGARLRLRELTSRLRNAIADSA